MFSPFEAPQGQTLRDMLLLKYECAMDGSGRSKVGMARDNGRRDDHVLNGYPGKDEICPHYPR